MPAEIWKDRHVAAAFLGFRRVACFWKYFDLALFGGVKA